jgi:uncharacterized protein DUF1559
MPRWFIVLLAVLASAVGCGVTGESTLDAMKRRAKAQADAIKEAEEQAKQRIAKSQKNLVKPAAAEDDAGQSVPAGGQPPPAIAKAKPNPSKADAKTRDATAANAPAAAGGKLDAAARPPIPVRPDSPLTEVQRRNKSAANLEQIIGALNKHAREKGTYPTQAIVSKPLGRPLLSWRVAILPYLGLTDFYQQFRLNEPWDSPHNAALLAHIPAVYVSPERCDEKTNYLAPHGPGTAWDGMRGKDPLSFADGADTTLIVLEVDESAAVPWTKPEDLPTSGGTVKSRLGKLRGEGFLAAFGSGYVAMIHDRITDGQLSWMLSPDGDDFLTDRTIIYDATVPDVALVTSEKKQEDESQGSATSATKKPKEETKDVASAGAGSAAPDRIRGLPPVKLPPPPKKPVRLPVPSEEDLAQARDQLRKIYEQEYRSSKTSQERQKLAMKMLADASRLEVDAAAYHEMLRMVREIAVQAGDITTALKAVELLETKLELPPLALRLKTLDDLAAAKADSSQGAGQLATEAEKVFRSAYEADDYPTALEALRIYTAMLHKGNDRAKVAQAGTYRSAILEAEKLYKLVPAALSALATNADNTEANEVAGKYFCLVKEQWEIGLPMMARGQDLKLRILARMDLEKDKTGPQIVQLADQYWDLAQEHKYPQRRSLQVRAAFHYAEAMRYLTPGVDLVKAEKRIEEVKRTYGADALDKAAGTASVLPTPRVTPKDDSG